MAKRDVVEYFLQVQNEYLELIDNVKEFDKELKAGNVTEEQLIIAQNSANIIKENYDRIAYILVLLNKPNRRSKKEDESSKQWYSYLKGASKESIIDENRDALVDFKKLVKEIKTKEGE